MRCRSISKHNFRKKQGLHNTPTPQNVTKAYISGLLHDSTERDYTFRISQKERSFVEFVQRGIEHLGYRAWTYKEGKARSLFVVEFSKRLLDNHVIFSLVDKVDYTRGYFDSDGGVPNTLSGRYYIYFAQKDLQDLKQVKNFLQEIGISCGRTHNPSFKVDPNYYRFYILARSHDDFARIIGSWHPRKSKFLRMKI
jgi:hypothetical protein